MFIKQMMKHSERSGIGCEEWNRIRIMVKDMVTKPTTKSGMYDEVHC